jgi:hypothetical protein
MLPKIPIELKKILMPNEHLSIAEFLQLPMPADSPPSFINVDNYLSIDMPDSMEPIHITLLQSVAIPPEKVLDAFEAIPDEKIKTSHFKSICIPYLSTSLRFPLWIMTYWRSLTEARTSQLRWKTAYEALERTISHSPLPVPLVASLINAQQALSNIPWNKSLQGFPGNPSVETLATYMTPNEWLTDEHEAQLLELLKRDLQEMPQKEGTNIEDVFFVSLICNAYKERGDYLNQRWEWIRETGEKYANGTWKEAATIIIISGNHWVPIVIDFENALVRHGDSLGGQLSEDKKAAIEWWTFTHSGKKFTHQSLPIARQRDGFSCGLFAWNALATYLCESTTLIDPGNMEVERLQVLLRLIKLATNSNAYKSLGSRYYDEGDGLDSDGSVDQVSFVESSGSYDEGDGLDSDGSVDRVSFVEEDTDTDMDMSDASGDKACSLTWSDLSKQEARNDPPATKISSIRNALEIAEKYPTLTTKAGILKYFKKATEDEIKEQRLREKDQWEFTQQNNEYLERIAGINQQNRKRELAKERQRRHRMKKKQSEIEVKIRSPGGTKKRVRN